MPPSPWLPFLRRVGRRILRDPSEERAAHVLAAAEVVDDEFEGARAAAAADDYDADDAEAEDDGGRAGDDRCGRLGRQSVDAVD